MLVDSIRHELSCLGLSLCPDNGCLGLLLLHHDDILGLLGHLLCNLLLLNGLREVVGELQVSN